jgi:hypothetical protein
MFAFSAPELYQLGIFNIQLNSIILKFKSTFCANIRNTTFFIHSFICIP